MLNLEVRKTLCTALVQCSFDYSCCSWYPGINETFKKKLQVMQNKMIRFILKLDNRSHIGNDELIKAGFLNVSDRIKQLKLGHVFKIWNKTCPKYLTENFTRLNENSDRSETRAKAYNFQVPRLSTNTFAYTAIKDWNSLSNKIKGIKGEQAFKENVKKSIRSAAKELEKCDFLYF